MTQPTGEGYVVNLRLDGSDVERVLKAYGFTAPPKKDEKEDEKDKKQKSVFSQIFKPLVYLYTMDKALKALQANSTIANTYSAAMGKIFGAAIDLLMTPFIPLFNLIILGMTKLISWLATSGILESIRAIMERAVDNLKGIWDWVKKIGTDLKELFSHPGKLFGDIGAGLKDAVASSVHDPKAAIATGASIFVLSSLAWSMLSKIPGFTALVGGVGKLAGIALRRVGKMLPGRGGTAGAAEEDGAAGMFAGGGKMGIGSTLMKAAGYGAVGYLGGDVLANLTGQQNTKAGGAMKGAGLGAGVGFALGGPLGALLGAGVGGLGGYLLGGNNNQPAGAQTAMGGGASMVNSGNTITINQNNVFSGSSQDPVKIANDLLGTIQKQTGYTTASKSVTTNNTLAPASKPTRLTPTMWWNQQYDKRYGR